MPMKIPGAMAGTSMANVVLGNPEAKVEHSQVMVCAADVWMREVELMPEWRQGSDFPSPVLYLTGNVVSIKGNMPHGVTTLVFKQDEDVEDTDREPEAACPRCGADLDIVEDSCPKCQARFTAEEKEEMRAARVERQNLDADGIPEFPTAGPEVRFRFEFTPAEKVELAEKGLLEPGFAVPGILTRNMFESMPVPCEFTTVVPDGPDDVPFTFVQIPNQLCIETTSAQCGYNLSRYFEMSKVMETQANLVAPLEDDMEAVHEEGLRKDYDDELLDMFESTGIDDDVFELAEMRDEVRDEGLGLTDADEGAEQEQAAEEQAAEEGKDEKQFDREKEGELLESILQGFSMGVPATEAVEHENEMRAQRRRRLQMQLEEEQREAERAEAEKADAREME